MVVKIYYINRKSHKTGFISHIDIEESFFLTRSLRTPTGRKKIINYKGFVLKSNCWYDDPSTCALAVLRVLRNEVVKQTVALNKVSLAYEKAKTKLIS